MMKDHGRYTYEMILEYYGETVANMAFEQHERLDGKGYPRGLEGDEISLAARILCVADAYDAMTVTRPYRKAVSLEGPGAIIKAEGGYSLYRADSWQRAVCLF